VTSFIDERPAREIEVAPEEPIQVVVERSEETVEEPRTGEISWPFFI